MQVVLWNLSSLPIDPVRAHRCLLTWYYPDRSNAYESIKDDHGYFEHLSR